MALENFIESSNTPTIVMVVTTIIGVVQLLLTLFASVIGWLVKGLFERIKGLEIADTELAKEISELRVELPTHYTSKNDFKEFIDNVFNMLRRIEDKIDRKADK